MAAYSESVAKMVSIEAEPENIAIPLYLQVIEFAK